MGLFSKPAFEPARTVSLVKNATGAPAVDLAKVRDGGHVDLAKRADKAGVALAKRGLAGIRAQTVLILDHSGSMHADYASGAVQTLVERALGFALQVDTDGNVPVYTFDDYVHEPVIVGVSEGVDRDGMPVCAYQGVVNRQLWRPNSMRSTNLADAVGTVRDIAGRSASPVLGIVVTDGEPNRGTERDTTRVVCDSARYPLFLKFLALRPVGFLSTLDTLGDDKRLLDNVNAQPKAGSTFDLLTCTDLQFAEAMADEWDEWIVKAQKAGVLS